MTDYERFDLRAMVLAHVQGLLAGTADPQADKPPWSQAVLADRAGLTQATLSRLLTGKRTGSLAVWQAVLDALDKHWQHLDAEEYKTIRARYRLAPASHS